MKSWWVDCLFDESNHTQHTVDVGVSSMERVYRADEADAENARLRAAISEFVEAFDRDPIKYADLMDRTREAGEAICRIAWEGR